MEPDLVTSMAATLETLLAWSTSVQNALEAVQNALEATATAVDVQGKAFHGELRELREGYAQMSRRLARLESGETS
jgi:hypothetical protein